MNTICRHFSFTLISATGLPDVRDFGRMKIYAEVSLRSSKTKWVTPVDKANDTNPKWNLIVKTLIPQSSIEEGSGHIVDIIDVILYCRRSLGDDKCIGQVSISLNELFQGSLSNTLTRPVWVRDHTQGAIKFSYSFGDLVPVKDEKDEQSSGKRFAKRIVVVTIAAAIVEGGKEVMEAIFDN